MKIAIVTGASSGMGREFVKQLPDFYQHLDEIWVIARRKERLEELSAQVPVKLRLIVGDLLQESTISELKILLHQYHPEVKMLVNAAGFGKSGNFLTIASQEEKAQLEMIDMNCTVLTQMCMICIPFMKIGSRILNLASAAAFCPQASFAVYAATKSYVLSFSRALGKELSGQKIFVTSVCPGPVKTEFFEVSGGMNNAAKAAFMADPRKVVKRALQDARRKKSLSIFGASMKAAHIAGKLLPHSLLLTIMNDMK